MADTACSFGCGPADESHKPSGGFIYVSGCPVHTPPSHTASADVDYKAAWEAAAKVVVAAGRFIEAEQEGNAALIEDAHFGLLKALTDYRTGGK